MNAADGTLILSGSDSYGGGTVVAAGTLIATGARHPPRDELDRRGAAGRSSSIPTGIPVARRCRAATPDVAVAAVPEPANAAVLPGVAGLAGGGSLAERIGRS